MAKSISDMFLSNGHLTKEALIDYTRGKYKKGTPEYVAVESHLQRKRCDCERRRMNLTGIDIAKSYEKEETHRIWSRISSFFYRFFGGNESFHG